MMTKSQEKGPKKKVNSGQLTLDRPNCNITGIERTTNKMSIIISSIYEEIAVPDEFMRHVFHVPRHNPC